MSLSKKSLEKKLETVQNGIEYCLEELPKVERGSEEETNLQRRYRRYRKFLKTIKAQLELMEKHGENIVSSPTYEEDNRFKDYDRYKSVQTSATQWNYANMANDYYGGQHQSYYEGPRNPYFSDARDNPYIARAQQSNSYYASPSTPYGYAHSPKIKLRIAENNLERCEKELESLENHGYNLPRYETQVNLKTRYLQEYLEILHEQNSEKGKEEDDDSVW